MSVISPCQDGPRARKISTNLVDVIVVRGCGAVVECLHCLFENAKFSGPPFQGLTRRAKRIKLPIPILAVRIRFI